MDRSDCCVLISLSATKQIRDFPRMSNYSFKINILRKQHRSSSMVVCASELYTHTIVPIYIQPNKKIMVPSANSSFIHSLCSYWPALLSSHPSSTTPLSLSLSHPSPSAPSVALVRGSRPFTGEGTNKSHSSVHVMLKWWLGDALWKIHVIVALCGSPPF